MLVVKNPSPRQEAVLSQLSKLRQSHEAGGVPPSWIIVSSCTTLESPTSEKLQSLLATRVAQGNDMLVKKMISAQRPDMDRSWHSRLKWLADGFNVKLKPQDEVDLLATVELRNAITHNGDRFTSRQVNSYEEFLKTRRLLETEFFLHIQGTRFTITPATADKVLGVARRVVVDLLK